MFQCHQNSDCCRNDVVKESIDIDIQVIYCINLKGSIQRSNHFLNLRDSRPSSLNNLICDVLLVAHVIAIWWLKFNCLSMCISKSFVQLVYTNGTLLK